MLHFNVLKQFNSYDNTSNLKLKHKQQVSFASDNNITDILIQQIKDDIASGDIFVKKVAASEDKETLPPLLSQNMADYPVNQFYILLTEKNFWKGDHRFNKEFNIDDDEEAFYKWFSEIKSLGIKKDNPLPKIDIDGPTGVKTIWKVMNDPERIHELMPLYIIACDWFYNKENQDNPILLEGNQILAKQHIEDDFGIKLDKKFKIKDYNYSGYLTKKKDYT